MEMDVLDYESEGVVSASVEEKEITMEKFLSWNVFLQVVALLQKSESHGPSIEIETFGAFENMVQISSYKYIIENE